MGISVRQGREVARRSVERRGKGCGAVNDWRLIFVAVWGFALITAVVAIWRYILLDRELERIRAQYRRESDAIWETLRRWRSK